MTYQFSAYDLTITPTGPTTLNLNPGESFHLEGTWDAIYDPSNGGCNGCVHQLYLAGLPSLSMQINLVGQAHNSVSGPYSRDFNAPLTAGVYYIGATYSLDNSFHNGVIGSANGSNQVSYILNVGDAVPTVPEPASLLLLGTGLLGAVISRRRGAR